MEPAKPRQWTEEETKLLIELVQRKERVPAMAREIGRHIASVRRRAREIGLPLPPGGVRGRFSPCRRELAGMLAGITSV